MQSTCVMEHFDEVLQKKETDGNFTCKRRVCRIAEELQSTGSVFDRNLSFSDGLWFILTKVNSQNNIYIVPQITCRVESSLP